MNISEQCLPEQCPKSANPYTYCPFVFRHEDDMILAQVSSLANDIKRINGLSSATSGREAELIDRHANIITAYMNGRLHQAIQHLKGA